MPAQAPETRQGRNANASRRTTGALSWGSHLLGPATGGQESSRMRSETKKGLLSTTPENRTAAASLAPPASLSYLRREAAGCHACDLWRNATQTVFGEGSLKATVMFVGEQPGDYEDRAGHPFVGPAGRALDDALREAGIDREQVYVTNVVKHFKWEPAERGKR